MEEPSTKANQRESLNNLVEGEFVFVTGKGGVGKSSVAATIALFAASRGKQCLIVYPAPAKGAQALWNTSLDDTPRRVAEGVDAVSIAAEAAMRQYVGEVLGSSKLASLLFHHRIARGLLTGIPGPNEWAILGRAWSLTKSGVRDGMRKERPYDLVVLDAPASGDSAGMLRVPQVILDLAPAARLRRDAESCLALLRDPARSKVTFVTLAEHLSISETEENLDVIREELDMPLGPIFVNQLTRERLTEDERKYLLTLPEPPADDSGPSSSRSRTNRCLSAGVMLAKRERLQQTYLRRIFDWGVPTIELPKLADDVTGGKAIKKLQMALAHGH